MKPLVFYEIKTKKSENFLNGLRQISFVCENNADFFCFLWLNSQNIIKKIQLKLSDNIIEWNSESGISFKTIKNLQNPPQRIGIRGVSDLISDKTDLKKIKSSTEILKLCEFPEEWKDIINSKLSL